MMSDFFRQQPRARQRRKQDRDGADQQVISASDAPLQPALNAEAARAMPLPAVQYDEAGFRFALNEDAMATEKLAEGIRSFAADAVKLEKLIQAV